MCDALPVIDEYPTHTEVWWDPPPEHVPYAVIHDHWDYAGTGKPVRFVYVFQRP
jgi:hypothetical protein